MSEARSRSARAVFGWAFAAAGLWASLPSATARAEPPADGRPGPRPTIRLVTDEASPTGGAIVVELDELVAQAVRAASPAERSAALRVFVLPDASDEPGRASPPDHGSQAQAGTRRPSGPLPPLLGRVSLSGRSLRFDPRLPFLASLSYRVVLDLTRFGGPGGELVLPAAQGEEAPSRTEVLSVWPSGPLVPENLLRIVLSFSRPMREGTVLSRVRLLDAATGEALAAFAEGRSELWDPERRRLTLLLDPGRIQPGLVEHERAGSPLRAGQRVRLELAEADRSVRLAQFEVGPRDTSSPDLASWTVTAPREGTREPLRIAFPEPLDHALLQRGLAVLRRGTRVTGEVEIGAGETSWQFVPRAPWVSGSHQVAADARLSDLAGNDLERPFDVDLALHRRSRGATAAPRFRLGFLVHERAW